LSNASLTILLLGIAVGIRQPILQRFAALEQNLMQKKLARVADVFVQRVEKLDSSAKAEATWTEMYIYSDRQPIQILSVRSPRLEYQQGEATLNQLTGVLFLVGISLGIIISLLAKAIQQQVQNLRIEHIGSPISAYVSVSLGISSLVPEQGTAPEILIEQSDQKLGVAELWDDFVRF
jgi:hypothetical protein